MTWFVYLAAGFGCMSLGACIGFLISGAFFVARHDEEQMDRFFQ